MIYRLAGSHFTLVVIITGILFVLAGLMTEQIDFLTRNYGGNFMPAEIATEGSIVLLIGCFGVFLEHRHYLLDKIYSGALPDSVARFDHASHNLGVMFIMAALFIEFLDLLFLSLNNWGFAEPWFKFLEISVLFAGNMATFIAFVIFGFWSFRERPTRAAPASTPPLYPALPSGARPNRRA